MSNGWECLCKAAEYYFHYPLFMKDARKAWKLMDKQIKSKELNRESGGGEGE